MFADFEPILVTFFASKQKSIFPERKHFPEINKFEL